MSRLFEALSNLQVKRNPMGGIFPAVDPPDGSRPQIAVADATLPDAAPEDEIQDFELEPDPEPSVPTVAFRPEAAEADQGASPTLEASPASRLVALTNPNGLGAEKFRALVTRLDHLRKTQTLTSFQVTSSVIHEGKTLVAGNVAVSLAKDSGCKTLLIEGDLHRPMLSPLLGLRDLRGLSDWWASGTTDLAPFLYKVHGMPLWFLAAGAPCDRPSEILRSERFANAFAHLAEQFEWTVVDSTPMLPIVDVNLWSRLVDGTLLVVREGMTPVNSLKKGLQALDHPKLIGAVMNEASDADLKNYDTQYYSAGKPVPGHIDSLS